MAIAPRQINDVVTLSLHRRDVVYFGVDENEDAKLTYYNCVEGQCVEIYNLTCNRTCDAQTFDFSSSNVAILQVGI